MAYLAEQTERCCFFISENYKSQFLFQLRDSVLHIAEKEREDGGSGKSRTTARSRIFSSKKKSWEKCDGFLWSSNGNSRRELLGANVNASCYKTAKMQEFPQNKLPKIAINISKKLRRKSWWGEATADFLHGANPAIILCIRVAWKYAWRVKSIWSRLCY